MSRRQFKVIITEEVFLKVGTLVMLSILTDIDKRSIRDEWISKYHRFGWINYFCSKMVRISGSSFLTGHYVVTRGFAPLVHLHVCDRCDS